MYDFTYEIKMVGGKLRLPFFSPLVNGRFEIPM